MLIVSGLLEVLWANLLKRTEGLTKNGPLVPALIVAAASVAMLGWSMQEFGLGAGYAAWAAIGTIGTVVVGMVVYDETLSPARFSFLALVVGGVIGLQFVGA